MTAFELLLGILIYFLPPLISTWAMVMWLPNQPKNKRVLWATLISASVLFISGVLYMAMGGLYEWAIIAMAFYFSCAFLLKIPLVAGADTLLYSGGKAILQRLSSRRVALGFVMVFLGFLFWLGIVGIFLIALENLPAF
jgi:hypothetical protein